MKSDHAAEDQSLPSLSRIFGYIAVKDLARVEDQVRVLSRLGYSNKETAIICDTTPETVATLKVRVKHAQKK